MLPTVRSAAPRIAVLNDRLSTSTSKYDLAMVTEPLVFPKGVRFPRDDEWPAGYQAELAELENVTITTGYVAHEQGGEGFSAYFEANAHAPEVFKVFRALAVALLPDIAAPIVGIKGEQPVFGHYTDRDAALGVFEPYVYELENDGFLEFGVMFQVGGITEEVFVHQTKYLKVWTNKPDAVRGVFKEHGIVQAVELRFIDSFPHVSETLPTQDDEPSWDYVFSRLTAAFELLPAR